MTASYNNSNWSNKDSKPTISKTSSIADLTPVKATLNLVFKPPAPMSYPFNLGGASGVSPIVTARKNV